MWYNNNTKNTHRPAQVYCHLAPNKAITETFDCNTPLLFHSSYKLNFQLPRTSAMIVFFEFYLTSFSFIDTATNMQPCPSPMYLVIRIKQISFTNKSSRTRVINQALFISILTGDMDLELPIAIYCKYLQRIFTAIDLEYSNRFIEWDLSRAEWPTASFKFLQQKRPPRTGETSIWTKWEFHDLGIFGRLQKLKSSEVHVFSRRTTLPRWVTMWKLKSRKVTWRVKAIKTTQFVIVKKTDKYHPMTIRCLSVNWYWQKESRRVLITLLEWLVSSGYNERTVLLHLFWSGVTDSSASLRNLACSD